MNYLFLFIMLTITTQLRAQNYSDAIKKYSDSTGNYKIEYHFNTSYFSMPAVENSQPHYDAYITVYKETICRCFGKNKMWVVIGEAFTGTYVPDGCFEDIPSEQVKRALSKIKSN